VKMLLHRPCRLFTGIGQISRSAARQMILVWALSGRRGCAPGLPTG
jgi:hypothetical protein